MRFLSLLLSVLMACQMTFATLPAYADVAYDASSGLSGEVPVNKVGALLLASGIAVMSGTAITVNNASGQAQLNGQLFKTASSDGNVSGSAYFGDGPGLSKLDSTACSEYVDLTDGTRVTGPVSGVTSSAITCAGQSIPMSSVAAVHAARVFNFTLKTGSSPRLSFSPTCNKVVAQTKKDAPHRSMKVKIIVSLAVIAIVACAIAIPIALTAGNNNNNNDRYKNQLAQQYFANQSHSSSVSSPAVSPNFRSSPSSSFSSFSSSP